MPGTRSARSCQVPDRARYLIVPGTRSCQVLIDLHQLSDGPPPLPSDGIYIYILDVISIICIYIYSGIYIHILGITSRIHIHIWRPPGRLNGGSGGVDVPPGIACNQYLPHWLHSSSSTYGLDQVPGTIRYLARSGTWHDQVHGTIWYLARPGRSGTWHDQS